MYVKTSRHVTRFACAPFFKVSKYMYLPVYMILLTTYCFTVINLRRCGPIAYKTTLILMQAH